MARPVIFLTWIFHETVLVDTIAVILQSHLRSGLGPEKENMGHGSMIGCQWHPSLEKR